MCVCFHIVSVALFFIKLSTPWLQCYLLYWCIRLLLPPRPRRGGAWHDSQVNFSFNFWLLFMWKSSQLRTSNLTWHKLFLPKVAFGDFCHRRGKVDESHTLGQRFSLCTAPVFPLCPLCFQGLFWVPFILMADWGSKRPEFSKGPSRLWSPSPLHGDFGVSVYLSYVVLFPWLLSGPAALSFQRAYFSGQGLLWTPPPSTGKGEGPCHGLSLALRAFCAFLHMLPGPEADHMIAHVPHRRELNVCRNVLMANIFHNTGCCSMFGGPDVLKGFLRKIRGDVALWPLAYFV